MTDSRMFYGLPLMDSTTGGAQQGKDANGGWGMAAASRIDTGGYGLPAHPHQHVHMSGHLGGGGGGMSHWGGGQVSSAGQDAGGYAHDPLLAARYSIQNMAYGLIPPHHLHHTSHSACMSLSMSKFSFPSMSVEVVCVVVVSCCRVRRRHGRRDAWRRRRIWAKQHAWHAPNGNAQQQQQQRYAQLGHGRKHGSKYHVTFGLARPLTKRQRPQLKERKKQRQTLEQTLILTHGGNRRKHGRRPSATRYASRTASASSTFPHHQRRGPDSRVFPGFAPAVE